MAKERINFKKDYKLFAACEKAESSVDGNTERVYFEHGNAYATDRHILIRVPLNWCTPFDDEQIAALNGFCVHAKILKLIYGFDVVTIEKTLTTEDAYDNLLEEAEPIVYIKAVYQGEQVRFRLERSDKEFVQKLEGFLASEDGWKPLNKVGINTALLHKISQALNMDSVQMDFTQSGGKIFIKSVMEEDQKSGPSAIIMPIQTEATLPGMDEEPDDK